MATDVDLLGMYGATTPAAEAQREQERRRAMTHTPEPTPGAGAYQPVTALARDAPLPIAIPTDAETEALVQAAQESKRKKTAAAQAAYAANRPASDLAAEAAATAGHQGPLASDLAAQAGQAQWGGVLDLAGRLDAQRKSVKVANKMYAPTNQYVATSRATEAATGAAEMGGLALGEQQADEVSAYYQDFQARDLAEQAVAVNREQAREERKQEQIDAVRTADMAVTRAADKLAATPGVDANRFWASRTAGQKVAALLSAAALGFSGRDPMAHLTQAIAEDIDAQKNAQDQAGNALGARQTEAGNARTLYNEILGEVQDERAADLVLEQSRLDAFTRQLDALEAKHGAAMRRPENERLRAQIQQRMADNKLRLDGIQAKNVPFRTKIVNKLGPNTRAATQQLIKEGVKTGGALTEKAFDLRGQEQKAQTDLAADLTTKAFDLRGQEQKSQAEMGVKQQELAASGDKELRAQAIDFGKQVAKLDRGLSVAGGLLDRYNKTGELAGYSSVRIPWGIGQGHTWGAEAQRTQDELGILRELATSDITGAVASPEQAELLRKVAEDKASEEEVIQGVQLLSSLFEAQKQSLASGYDPRAIELHANTAAIPKGEVNIRGLGGNANDPTAGGRIKIDE